MRARTLGANPPDAAITAASLIVVAVLLAPSYVTVGAVAPALTLVEATMADNSLTLRFTGAVIPEDDSWPSFVEVRNGDVIEAVGAGRATAGGMLELFVPSGMFVGDPVRVTLKDGIQILGTDGRPVDRIVDAPATGGASPTMLPSSRGQMRGAWIEGAFHVFGGRVMIEGADWRVSTNLDQIVRHDPVAGRSEVLETRLPRGSAQQSVAIDPQSTDGCPRGCVYLFPGEWGMTGNHSSAEPAETMRFDPVSGTVTTLGFPPDTRPVGAGVAWGGDAFYSLGGLATSNDPISGRYVSPEIWRYDPDANQWTRLATRLPFGVAMGSASFDPTPTAACPAGCIYHVGGWQVRPEQPSNAASVAVIADAIRFDPTTGLATPIRIDAPDTRIMPWSQSALHGGAIWWEESALVGDERSRRLARLDLADGSFSMHPIPTLDERLTTVGALVTDGDRFWVARGMDLMSFDPPQVG